MKTRIAAAVASFIIASLGTAAYAQAAQPAPQQPPSATSAESASSSGQSGMNNMSSSRIERKVKQELTSHGVTATHVDVQFSDGTATLTGTVFTKADINKAKMAAMHVRGVKHVDTSGLHARQATAASAQSSGAASEQSSGAAPATSSGR